MLRAILGGGGRVRLLLLGWMRERPQNGTKGTARALVCHLARGSRRLAPGLWVFHPWCSVSSSGRVTVAPLALTVLSYMCGSA